MKRQTAFRHLWELCRRLDGVDPGAFFILPKKLYLFGSALTDKPDPKDVDLVLLYEERPDRDLNEFVMSLVYGNPPFVRASRYLRHGMRNIRLAPAERSLENWPDLRLFPGAQGLRLIWMRGFDWTAMVGDIEANPVRWPGPRSVDASDRELATWNALSDDDRRGRVCGTLSALEAQEELVRETGNHGAWHLCADRVCS